MIGNRVARAVYGAFGVAALGLGALALIRPALALPPDAVSPLTAHLIREQGAEGIFIGLMALWCAFNLDRRRPVHLALLVFTAAFAAIHWAEYFQARRHLASPLLNSIPFVAFALTTPPRRES
ncbi:MAG TPA: hypothetical protein VJ826_10970 [Candidatus Polarisedimenticolaceae bacterium]|nr:hypothetical protein [Candidatus Polarisedimenticolaceae bacterium]